MNVLEFVHIRAQCDAGFAADLPESYLPKELRRKQFVEDRTFRLGDKIRMVWDDGAIFDTKVLRQERPGCIIVLDPENEEMQLEIIRKGKRVGDWFEINNHADAIKVCRTEAAKITPGPLTHNHPLFNDYISVMCDISPENLTCDGELSAAQVRRRRSEIQRRWDALDKQMGRHVEESEVWAADEVQRKPDQFRYVLEQSVPKGTVIQKRPSGMPFAIVNDSDKEEVVKRLDQYGYKVSCEMSGGQWTIDYHSEE